MRAQRRFPRSLGSGGRWAERFDAVAHQDLDDRGAEFWVRGQYT